MEMESKIKSLAEWLSDPTTCDGDVFLLAGACDRAYNTYRVEVFSKLGDVVAELGSSRSDGWGWSSIPVGDYAKAWRRAVPALSKLTAEQALARGLVVLAATP